MSSSAKADDPVVTESWTIEAVGRRNVRGYWMPAFAGMTMVNNEIALHRLQ
jgi:hypothetical protein